MRFAKPVVLLLLSLIMAAPPAAAGVVSFAPEARVGGDKVTLACLASDPEGLDPDLRRALAGVTVMAAPRLGGTSRVDASRLKALLRQAELPAATSVLLPQEVEVSRASQKVPAARVGEIFRQALARRLAKMPGEADVHSVRPGRELVLPAGELGHRVRFLGNRLTGLVAGRVELLVDGKPAASRRVSAQVDLYGPVVVAAKSLPRRHVLARDDLKVVRARLNQVRGAVGDAAEVVGLRTRSAVPLGEPLKITRLERTPLIKRGDVVQMICQRGKLKVVAKGRAEETGYRDSSIKLTNLASDREVYGKVLDSGAVLVTF
jgi:flagella basal body P-ring formation protein FlgA